MAKTPEQGKSRNPSTGEATVFVSPNTAAEAAAERLAFAEEVDKRIQKAIGSVGLTGIGEAFRKQKFQDGMKERIFVTRAKVIEAVDYKLIKPNGSIAEGSFDLGISRHDGTLESASASFHPDENSVVEGQIALALIDLVIEDVFPDKALPTSDQTQPTEA